MGCFHSVQLRVPAAVRVDTAVAGTPERQGGLPYTPLADSPPHEIHVMIGEPDIDDCFDGEFVDANEHESEGILSVSVTSPDQGVRSDLAEDTASRSGDSVDALGDSETPGPIVSPNPQSPSESAPPKIVSTDPLIMPVCVHSFQSPIIDPTPPGTIRFSGSTPVEHSKPPTSSRLIEISNLRNSRLCMQVFGVWRADMLKSKVDTLKSNLDLAGKASEIILAENDQLKTRLHDMEKHMETLKLVKPIKSIEIQTEVPTTPQKPLQDISNFVTPPSARSQVLATSTFITPPEEPALRRPWDSVLPSTSIAPPIFSNPIKTSPLPIGTSPQSEKFRRISNDIAKLTESIGKFELRQKTPVTSAVTPKSTYTP